MPVITGNPLEVDLRKQHEAKRADLPRRVGITKAQARADLDWFTGIMVSKAERAYPDLRGALALGKWMSTDEGRACYTVSEILATCLREGAFDARAD